jgi:isoaspartyl peptidase/L-asparaginase-like protein (Ntn-hydrolase superfamily)
MKRVVVVHLGAGVLPEEREEEQKRFLKRMLLEDVETEGEMVRFMKKIEMSGYANCGIGSNRTREGLIECEAGIMRSTGEFASACLVPPELSATEAAWSLLNEESEEGLSKPLSVAYLPTVLTSGTGEITLPNGSLDTAGALFCDGVSSIAFSTSGGTRGRRRGRIGPCSFIGANTYADSEVCAVASGTGESLIRTHFCRRAADSIKNALELGLEEEIHRLEKENPRFPYVGGVSLFRKGPSLILLHFQNAPAFIFGYSIEKDGRKRVSVHVSRRGKSDGCIVNIHNLGTFADSPSDR